jgi:hypothetical protein
VTAFSWQDLRAMPARDLATIMDIVEDRRIQRRVPGEVGVAQFH